MPTRDEEMEIRRALKGAEDEVESAANPPSNELDLDAELQTLYKQSSRVQERAARLLDEATAYNDRLRGLIDSYKEADAVMKKVSDDA